MTPVHYISSLDALPVPISKGGTLMEWLPILLKMKRITEEEESDAKFMLETNFLPEDIIVGLLCCMPMERLTDKGWVPFVSKGLSPITLALMSFNNGNAKTNLRRAKCVFPPRSLP